ncbi:unnamed protein product, partial [marine sediment metagenome]
MKFQNKLEAIDKLKSYLQSERSEELSLWERLRQPNNTVAETLSGRPDIKNAGFQRDELQAAIID